MEPIQVGRIWRAHGVRGEVRIVPETDDPERLFELDTLWLGEPDALRRVAVVSTRPHRNKKGVLVVARLEGVDTREAAEALHGVDVWADAADLPPLDEDEFYVHDLVGLRVEDEDGAAVGVVRDVLEGAAQDVLVIAREGRPDAMVPLVPELVPVIEPEHERVVVRPIEGLLD